MYNEECIMKKKEYTRPNTMLIAIGTQYGMMDSLSSEEGNPGEIMSKENTSTWDFEEEENQ